MNWPTKTLDSVAELDRKSINPSDANAATPYIGLEHLDREGTIDCVETVGSAELKSNKFLFTNRHILFGKLRPYLRKIARPDFSGVCSTDIIPILTKKGLSRDYLFHLLRTPSMVELATRRSSGANLPRLSPKQLAAFQIPLPPLAEQKRIAGILDAADALRSKRRESLAQLDILLQSTFLDMFGDPVTNPMGWDERTFGELFEISSSKRVLQKQWQTSGVPFYRAREIVKLSVDGKVANELCISEDLYEEFRSKHGAPEPGDLMVSAVGTLGACYMVQSGDKFYFKDASVLRFRPTTNIEPVFVQFAFGTDHILRQVRSGSGSTVGTYTISRARETRLFVPPLENQRHFVTIVESAKQQKASQRAHLTELDNLFASLQSRAFRGDL